MPSVTTRCVSIPKVHQKGLALFMSLVILLVVTLLGVASVQTTMMEEQMSRNSRDANIAMLAAESAIEDGETYIETLGAAQAADDAAKLAAGETPVELLAFIDVDAEANGLYFEASSTDTPNWVGVVWSDPDGSYLSASTSIAGVETQPKYIIEYIKTVNVVERDSINVNNVGQSVVTGRSQIFRVTAFGTGGSADARAMLQSTYGRRLD